jgi:signal transduction histidine kinase
MNRCAAWALGLVLSGGALAEPPAAAMVAPVNEAVFLKSDSTTPPSTEAQLWEQRTLPDLWRTHRPSEAGFGWYRLGFEVTQAIDEPWALRASWVNSALAVWLNGAEVWRDPSFDAAHLTPRASPPYLVVLPASLLIPGRNALDIRLRTERDINAGLSTVEVGPQKAVAPSYLAERFWRIDLPRTLNLAVLVAALFVGLLGWRRPGESLYPWFCALALTWAGRALYYSGDDRWLLPLRAPLGLGSGDFFLATSLSLGFVLLAIVVNRFANQPRHSIERIGLALSAAAPLTISPLGHQVLEPLRPAWAALALLFAVHASVAAIRLALRERQWSHAEIVAGIFVMTGTGVHDWMVLAGWLPYQPLPWLSFGPPSMLAMLVLALGGRYFQALDQSARLNTELEQRIAVKARELEQHYDRIAQLESVAAVAHERERLMRDMHDGVGSQLITLQHALDKGGLDGPQAASLVRDCVEDLRLVIDSLDASAHSMTDALANLRFRLEPRLAAAGMVSTWHIERSLVPMSPEVVLQLLRILQESLTNVLKHSGAHLVHVSWRVDTRQGHARLLIHDDGCGLPPDRNGAGRGLTNMHLRARRIGALFELPADRAGTTVQITLPVKTDP